MSAVASEKPTPVHLAAAVAIALAAWSVPAGAAGLGRLAVNSALGQPPETGSTGWNGPGGKGNGDGCCEVDRGRFF